MVALVFWSTKSLLRLWISLSYQTDFSTFICIIFIYIIVRKNAQMLKTETLSFGNESNAKISKQKKNEHRQDQQLIHEIPSNKHTYIVTVFNSINIIWLIVLNIMIFRYFINLIMICIVFIIEIWMLRFWWACFTQLYALKINFVYIYFTRSFCTDYFSHWPVAENVLKFWSALELIKIWSSFGHTIKWKILLNANLLLKEIFSKLSFK